MKEEYLHYLFKTKQLGKTFSTSSNQLVEILNFGIHNHNSGPDFLECKITLDGKIWAGQIEFHVKSSDWNRHKHQFDLNYKNVILHIVFEHDVEIKSGLYVLPTVEVKELISLEHYNRYKSYVESKNWISCSQDIESVDEFTIVQQKEKVLLNRLIRKSNLLIDLIEVYQGDRKKVFYISLFSAFGTKVNRQSFKALGELFDWKFISKFSGDENKIEAYMFGIAGFLNENFDDEHYLSLQTEFRYLNKMYNLNSLKKTVWKFSAMRPSNLPTIRLAQLVALLTKEININNWETIKEIRKTLKIELSNYWKNHYMFNRMGKRKNSGLTDNFIDLIIINVIVPYRFCLGLIENDDVMKEKALGLLLELKSEKNSIITNWIKIGVKSESAFDSQALLEQKNEFCNKHLCLKCKIGQQLLKCSA